MPTGDSSELFGALAEFGYSLLQPKRFREPNDLLARMSASSDAHFTPQGHQVFVLFILQTCYSDGMESSLFLQKADCTPFITLQHSSFVHPV